MPNMPNSIRHKEIRAVHLYCPYYKQVMLYQKIFLGQTKKLVRHKNCFLLYNFQCCHQGLYQRHHLLFSV